MSGKTLLKKRVLDEWRYQWRVIHSVLDWTVILYIVTPISITASIIYFEAWQNTNLYWQEQFPFSSLLCMILLFSLKGNVRTYVMEADLLYVIQRKKLFYELKVYGFILSIVKSMFGTMFIFILFLPVFINVYHLSVIVILCLYITVCCFHLVVMTLKKIVRKALYKGLSYFIIFISFILILSNISYMIYGIGSIIAIFLLIYFHMTRLTQTNHFFLKELEIEDIERLKYVRFIMHFSMEVEKVPNRLIKTPLIFRKSKRIFKERNRENGLLEFLLKSFLRNRNYILAYYQIIMVTLFAMILVPFILKWIIYISSFFFIKYWLRNIYIKMLESPFFTIITIDEELRNVVWMRFRKWTLFPPVILFSVPIVIVTIFFFIT